MRKIYTLFFLTIISFCYSQQTLGKYIIKSQSKIKAPNSTFGDGCKNEVRLNLYFNNNINKTILNEDLNSISSNSYTDYGVRFDSIDANPNLAPLKIVSTASRNWKRLVGGCGGNGSFNDTQHEKAVNFCANSYVNDGLVEWWNHDVKIEIFPKLVIEDPNGIIDNFLSTDDKININSHYGFRIIDYSWQYSTDGFTYNDLPQYAGMSSISVSAVDILGNKTEENIGKSIWIRQRSDCGNYSNIVEYRILKSSPKVLSTQSANTTCYDSNDGQMTIQFDRPLETSANEYISLNLLNAKTGIPVNNVKLTNITHLDSNNSFKIDSLQAGDYELRIIGKYNGGDTYSPYATDPIKFTISKNPPVDFIASKTDAWCYEGSDGTIQISANGGTGKGYQYQINNGAWISFPDTTSGIANIKNLPSGIYSLKVMDSNGCIAKLQVKDTNGDIALGNEKVIDLEIKSPQKPLTVTYTLTQEPTYNGALNGKIVAQIDGGTIFDDNTYWYEWKNDKGEVLNATPTITSGSYYLTLDNIPSGTYKLTIRDKNYSSANDNKNCTIIESLVELKQPEPLVGVIELVRSISCHVDNEFGNETDVNPQDGKRDESQDGTLKIVVSGGKPFTGSQNGGRPYKYTWKKQNADGSWSTLPNIEDTIYQLNDGTYAANAEDANGIVIGQYQGNVLVTAKDVIYKLQQPDKLTLNLSSTPATCAGGDGAASAVVAGGTPPYTYLWTNGQTSPELKNLEAKPYSLVVTDSRGCRVEGTVTVTQPDGVVLTEVIKPLLCHNASDASIELSVTGGTAPYKYLWNNGATTSSIYNLASGNYSVTVTDQQGCSYTKSYTISNPAELKIDLGADRTLCVGQTLNLDATITSEPGAKYSWSSDNGFVANTPNVELVNPGAYTVTATTVNGCIVTDKISIIRSDFKIDSEFLQTTQAYVNEEVVLVNVSNPKGQTTEWIISDPSINIISKNDDYVNLKFPKEGKYTIQLKQTQGDCYMVYNKDIIVEASSGMQNQDNVNAAFIQEFTVTPNPSNGNFNVIVKLEKESPIKLRLYTMVGQLVQPVKTLPASKIHNVQYNLMLNSASYVLVLETPYQTMSKKLIIY